VPHPGDEYIHQLGGIVAGLAQPVGPGHLLEVAARQRKKERVHRASPPRSRLPGPDLLEVIAF